VSSVLLRPMRWWDVEQVIAIERAVFAADPWSEAGFWSELAGVPSTRYYVVAQDGADLVGYAGLLAVPPEADVQTVAVRPDRQGRGLGRTLVLELLAEAGRRACTAVALEVREENAAARHLYTSLGFDQVASRRGYYGPGADALILRRTLVRDDGVLR
jgi:[ribosomal protein S18]-alanine N-acetyltransferase